MASFKEFAIRKALATKGKKAWGNYRGYMITVMDQPKAKGLCIAAGLFDENIRAEVERFIVQQENGGIRLVGLQVNNNHLCIWIETNRDDYKMMDHMTEHLINLLTSLGVKGVAHCAHCGQPIVVDGSMVTVDDVVMEMHNACIEHHNAQLDANRKEIASQGNMFTGILGALLGGIVGSIPWIIASALGWFVGWLGFLIGLCAKKGYEILKGKTCRLKGFIVIAATIVSVILAEFIAAAISIGVDPEIGITVGEALIYIFPLFLADGDVAAAMMGDIAMGLLFAGLGIFSLARNIFSETSAKAGKALRIK